MKRKQDYADIVFLLLILSASFLVSYLFAYKMMGSPWTDLGIHVSNANGFFDGTVSNAYPGFYLAYGLFSRILGFADVHAAATAMGFFSVLTGIAVYSISGYLLEKDTPKTTRCWIVLFMNFFGPLYLGGGTYYIGQGSFNTWHNPTNSSVKFVALICFFLFVYAYQMKSDDTVVV